MGEIINMPDSDLARSEEVNESVLMEIADGLLFDARAEISEQKTLSVPLAQLAAFGAGVSSLIPALRTVVKEGRIDEFLQDSGRHIKSNAKEIKMSAITAFAEIGNPETRVFIDNMEDMIRIYNHTERICFDDKKIYLIAG